MQQLALGQDADSPLKDCVASGVRPKARSKTRPNPDRGVLLHVEEGFVAAEGMAERIAPRSSRLLAPGDQGRADAAALQVGARDTHAAHDLARRGAPAALPTATATVQGRVPRPGIASAGACLPDVGLAREAVLDAAAARGGAARKRGSGYEKGDQRESRSEAADT